MAVRRLIALVAASAALAEEDGTPREWTCFVYNESVGQDDDWCKSRGVHNGIEFKWWGPDTEECGKCWCCIASAESTSTQTTSTVTTSTQTTSTRTTTTESTTTTTSLTATTSTITTSTATRTTTTVTSTTTSTSTSTTGPHMIGGNITKETFKGWLSVWRSKYNTGLWKAGVTDPWESMLPKALKHVEPKIVMSEGGVASGIVTEGMGYGIMIEGFLASHGDNYALQQGLALVKSWLGMVAGPAELGLTSPLAGGAKWNASSTKADNWPYGISAVEWSHLDLGPAGVPAWKFPIKLDEKTGQIDDYMGSAADGDQDAVLGMIYLAAAMGYPEDFVDMVMRTVISFASADLGFPDLYRILPDGTKIFVPKLGSMWGGLLPEDGDFKSKQEPWCYSPGYFAPAHYRTMRNFVKEHWSDKFDDYLPTHQDDEPTSQAKLVEAFDSAITAGYNILYYSSCDSGAVSNWVGVESACADDSKLHCKGVPWKHTPWVGAHGGECKQSGTRFGAYGADASRTAWRLAMDYALFREESSQVTWYDRDGNRDDSRWFGARAYLNRIVMQYKYHAICDGGVPFDCMKYTDSPYELAYAFDPAKGAPEVNCSNVPNPPESWWAGFMSYPTFSAFVAPYDEIGAAQMTHWMDTFSRICNFSGVDMWNFFDGDEPVGKLCLTSYFEASQAVIALMIMSGSIQNVSSAKFIPEKYRVPITTAAPEEDTDVEQVSFFDHEEVPNTAVSWSYSSRTVAMYFASACVFGLLLGALVFRGRQDVTSPRHGKYEPFMVTKHPDTASTIQPETSASDPRE